MYTKISTEKQAQLKKALFIYDPDSLLKEILACQNGLTIQQAKEKLNLTLSFYKRSLANEVINIPVNRYAKPMYRS